MLVKLRDTGFDARGFDTVAGRGDDTGLTAFADGLATLITVVRDTDQLAKITQSGFWTKT